MQYLGFESPYEIMYFFYLIKDWSAQTIKDVGVPRKCNVMIIVNNKIHLWLQDRKGQDL
jgi:hypothetical protein